MANNPTYDDFLRAQTARRVAFEQSRKPAEQESDQGIWGDAVDMFQRGLGQTLGGDLETVGQLTDSQGIKDAGRGVSAWADGQLEQASTPMREAMGKQFFQENAETGAIEAGDAWADPRAWAGNFSTVLGQFVGLVGGTKGAGLIAKPALRGAGKLLAKDLVEGQAKELVAKATVKDAISAGALDSVRAAYLAAPGEAAKRAVLDKAIGRLTSIGYGAHAGAMASGMRAQQAEQEARGYFNGLGNDELNANPIYQQAYWDLADGEMRGADIGDIRRAAIDSVAERAATDAWSDPRALAADFTSGLLTGAGAGVGGLLGKVGSTRAGAAVRGFAGEGATEAWQGGETQRAVNQAVQEWADESRDPMAGVLSAALNEGTIGGAFGGVVGAVHGPQAPDMAKPVVRVERRVVTGDQQMDDMIHGLDQRQAERGASISSEIDSMFAGASNPLGSGKFDPVRDVPAYQRQGFVRGSHDFQGKPIVPLEGELLDPATALSATPSGPLPDMGGQPSDPALDMAAIADQRISGELQDEAALPGPQANLLPGATYEGESREVGTDLPVPRGPAPALPESSNAATVPLPESVRLTRRGLPFSSEKEAALASRQDETPIPLDGGGFGIAKIAELEQGRSEQAATVPQDINQEVRDNGLSQPLASAVDTGYREEITATQPQVEVSNEQAPRVLAISSERQGDQSGAGQPVAESAGAATTGLSDRAGTGDRADLLASAPVPDGQQQNDQTLTAPDTDAGVDVSGSADPAPLPWAESINNADGTITLKGEIPIIRQWAKDNGVKAIPGKGGVVVAKSSAAKVLDMVAPAATEPVRQIEAARAEVAPEPTEAQKEAGNYKKGHLTLQGLDIALENPKGSTRSGTDQDGKAWQSTMAHDYGYIKRTLGADGDHVDVFIGDQPDSETVYVVDQVDPKTGKFDEHKVMMGFADEQAARAGYLANYEKGWKGLGTIKAMPVDEFKTWVKEGDTTKPVTSQGREVVKADTLADDEAISVADELGIEHGDNPDDARWALESVKPDALAAAVGRVRNPSQPETFKPRTDSPNIVAAPPVEDEVRKGVVSGKPDRVILFSKQAMAQGDKPAKSLTRKEADLVTKEWFKQYKGAAGIDVQIHATQAELEQALGLDAKEGLIRRAAFDDDTGTLHVAADTIANPKRMREILRHEVLAHYGLANVLGDGEYTKLISRLIKSKKDPSMKAVWDWVDTHYADEDIGVQAEEVVAHLAELEQGAWGRGWDQVVAWVTKALRAVGFVPDGITAAETRSLIDGLGKNMKRGSPDDSGPDGGKKFSQEEQPAKKGSIKMSQTSTQADDAMKKLNLGPKPDVIDNTKANLDKLRAVDRGVVKSLVDRFIKKANTEVLDALAPIKYAEQAAGITDAADSGYIAARMATGAASTMQATMLYGLPEWKDGVIQRKAGTGEKDALLGIFSDLGKDLHNWLGWMAGHRAELLMEQGRENLLSEQDIAALKGLGKGKEAKFMEAKARWNRLNAATLDLAQEAGLFTADARAEFENEWYIPFFRESDDGDVIAPFKPKGIANQNAGIKKLKGGEANTNDLLENIFTSTSKLIDASMKNMAAQKTVWNLADTGAIEVVAKPNMMDWRALKNGKDLITVKLEGEDYMIRVVDPDLYRAMTFFDRQPFGDMVNMASKAKRLLTAGVTASPEFMLRNFLRDSLSSWAISKDGFKPVIDSLKGVRKTWRMEGSTIDVMFSGASFLGGYVNGNDPTAMADTVRKSLRRKGMTPEQITQYEKSFIRNAAQAKGVVADVWEKYNRLGEAVENGNREAVYEAAIKAGKSHAQAAFESKDLMDFSMLGAARTIQMASLVLPFFNARIQGLGKLSRELRDNPREIAKRAGMITAMSLGLLAMNWDDERYEELPDWDKDSNWHFFVGDQHFRIPKPFEIGVMFGTIPERMVRALGDKDTGAQFGKAVARAIGDTFALNPTPQIVKPMVEAAFNYDSFRGGPIDGPQDLAVKAEARYNEQTSLLMRELGELSGFSPKQLEHLVIGYTGTIGSYVMAAADGLIRAASPGESASWRADEIPLVKAVYRGTGPAKSTQHMEEFYRMLNEVNQLKRTVDQYRSEGLTDKANELLDEQGGILKSRRSLSRTQQQVRVVRNKIELIQRDKIMTAEEKRRRIDELLARRNDLVYQAVNRNIQNWE
ncbi:LPD38 domain-containing protein [Aeromonas salmonicida]|uniref:LPD38 domain-containing protein n=1 Tax=Aeromonas salmonicida TaxID=645 RepID=UPI003D091CAE